MHQLSGIQSLIGLGNLIGPATIQCFTSGNLNITLALKLFRGEPAISEFDWNFSAIHKSSATIATGVGSALHEILLSLQPAHG